MAADVSALFASDGIVGALGGLIHGADADVDTSVADVYDGNDVCSTDVDTDAAAAAVLK
jgi:ferredoxin-fold anticodon binding domain-containing protein